MQRTPVVLCAIAVVAILLSAGCVKPADNHSKEPLVQPGSSPVLPLGVAWAEAYSGADVTGSGGGWSRGINALLNKEADLGDSSRIMKASDYKALSCTEADVTSAGEAIKPCNGVLPEKWVVAFDVLAVVVNNDNSWTPSLNFSKLYKISTADSPAVYWDQVPGLAAAPHEKIEVYAPDKASGIYDYFFERIIPNWGKDTQQARTRLDSGDGVYHPSADDNVIVTAINANRYAIGYFGYAYYKENTGKVKVVAIEEKAGKGAVVPSEATVATYPLARPLHIYTDANSPRLAAVKAYLRFVLSDKGQGFVSEVGYITVAPVDGALLTAQKAK